MNTRSSTRTNPLLPQKDWAYGQLVAVATMLLTLGSLAHADAPAFPEAAYRKHIEVLSSDAFEGRAPGTAGEQKTLAYIEQQFRAAGLQPGIGNSFLQPVPMVEITPHADAAMQLAGAGGKSLALRSPDDLVVWTKRPVPSSGLANAEVVYAGYGIVAPEYGWNDYAGLDVRGKLVLALVNDPGFATQDPKLFTGNAMTVLRPLGLQVRRGRASRCGRRARDPRDQGRRLPVGRAAQRRVEAAVRPAHRRLRRQATRARRLDHGRRGSTRAVGSGHGLRSVEEGFIDSRLQGRGHGP